MKRWVSVLAYAVLGTVVLLAWGMRAEHRASDAASALCAAIPVGMLAAEARRVVAATEGLERRLDTPMGMLAIFSGAFMFSRYTCEVTLAERVTATRLNHIATSPWRCA